MHGSEFINERIKPVTLYNNDSGEEVSIDLGESMILECSGIKRCKTVEDAYAPDNLSILPDPALKGTQSQSIEESIKRTFKNFFLGGAYFKKESFSEDFQVLLEELVDKKKPLRFYADERLFERERFSWKEVPKFPMRPEFIAQKGNSFQLESLTRSTSVTCDSVSKTSKHPVQNTSLMRNYTLFDVRLDNKHGKTKSYDRCYFNANQSGIETLNSAIQQHKGIKFSSDGNIAIVDHPQITPYPTQTIIAESPKEPYDTTPPEPQEITTSSDKVPEENSPYDFFYRDTASEDTALKRYVTQPGDKLDITFSRTAASTKDLLGAVTRITQNNAEQTYDNTFHLTSKTNHGKAGSALGDLLALKFGKRAKAVEQEARIQVEIDDQGNLKVQEAMVRPTRSVGLSRT